MVAHRPKQKLCVAAAAAAVLASQETTCSVQAVAAAPPTNFLAVRGGGPKSFEADNDDVSGKKKQTSKRKKKKKAEKRRGSFATEDSKNEEAQNKEGQRKGSTSEQSSSSSSLPKPSEKDETNSVAQEILELEDYYAILGTTKATVAAASNPGAVLKKAYRRRTLHTHPDKLGSDRKAFDKVTEAYEVLQDDNKRRIYDRMGKRGLDSMNNAGGGSPFAGTPDDLFRSFFGSGNPFAHPQQQQQTSFRNRTSRYQLEVTLEDLYRGLTQTVSISAPTHGPYWHRPQHEETKRVDVHIPRGALDGQSIVLAGEMDFDAAEVPGDLVFLVHQRRHPVFTRRGHDLAMTLDISLREAVCGVSNRTIRHLDGRDIQIASARREAPLNKNDEEEEEYCEPLLIQSGDVQVLKGLGMPKDPTGTEFGDLYVQFDVSMPKPSGLQQRGSLSREEREELGRLLDKLDGRPSSKRTASLSDETHILSPAALSDFGVASGRPEMPRDPEEEPDHGFQQFRDGRFYFSAGSPFFGGMGGGHRHSSQDDDGSAQCRQM